MKNLTLFKNAYKHYHAGEVKFNDLSLSKLYYSVQDTHSSKEHLIILGFRDSDIIECNCPCSLTSIKARYLPLCSHIVAASTRAMFDFGRENSRYESIPFFREIHEMYKYGKLTKYDYDDNSEVYIIDNKHKVTMSFNEKAKVVSLTCSCCEKKETDRKLFLCKHMVVVLVRSLFDAYRG